MKHVTQETSHFERFDLDKHGIDLINQMATCGRATPDRHVYLFSRTGESLAAYALNFGQDLFLVVTLRSATHETLGRERVYRRDGYPMYTERDVRYAWRVCANRLLKRLDLQGLLELHVADRLPKTIYPRDET